MKLLLLDIETAPSIAHVWGLWQNDVALSQLLESGYVMCWSAKWVGEKKMFFSSLHKRKPKKMLSEIHSLLSDADAVVSWNGSQFDIPTLNREFLRYGFDPPAPYSQIDLLMVAKKRFRFLSNKLEYVSKALKCGEKMKNEGHRLWVKCMAGSSRAWADMKRYNLNDTAILEGVYKKFLPWISNHPHVGLRDGDPESCPNCGGTRLQARGWAYTQLGKYRRYQCQKCGTWTRNAKRVMMANQRGVVA